MHLQWSKWHDTALRGPSIVTWQAYSQTTILLLSRPKPTRRCINAMLTRTYTARQASAAVPIASIVLHLNTTGTYVFVSLHLPKRSLA